MMVKECQRHSNPPEAGQIVAARLLHALDTRRRKPTKEYSFCLGKVAQAEMSLNVCVCPRL